MTTLSLELDEELNTALEALSAKQGRDKGEVIADILREYVERQRLKSALEDPLLVQLYQHLAAEDIALAEEGMADYQRLLREADGA